MDSFNIAKQIAVSLYSSHVGSIDQYLNYGTVLFFIIEILNSCNGTLTINKILLVTLPDHGS